MQGTTTPPPGGGRRGRRRASSQLLGHALQQYVPALEAAIAGRTGSRDLVEMDALHPITFTERLYFIPTHPKNLSDDELVRWRRWRMEDMIALAALLLRWRHLQSRDQHSVHVHARPPNIDFHLGTTDFHVLDVILHNIPLARVREE